VANAMQGTPSPSPSFRSIDDHAEPRTAAEDSTTSPQFDENWQSYNGPGLAYPFEDNYHDFANWEITNDNVFRNDAQFGMFNEPTNDDLERNADFNDF